MAADIANNLNRRIDDRLPTEPLDWEDTEVKHARESTRLATAMADAGAAFLAHMGNRGVIAQVPDTDLYVVAGTLPMIAKVLPGEQSRTAGAARQGGITSEENGAGDLPSPPAPEHWYYCCGEAKPTDGYTLEQLYDFARAAIASYLARQPKAEQPDSVCNVLQAARKYIEAAGEVSGYGFSRHANPHHFHPDAESCSADEIAAHKAACEAYDKGEYTPERGSEWVGAMHILRAPWGIGSYTFMDPHAEKIIADIDAALAPVAPASAQNAEAIRNAALEDAVETVKQQAANIKDIPEFTGEQEAYNEALEHSIAAIRALQSGTATSKEGGAA